jgi:hypothetical protein
MCPCIVRGEKIVLNINENEDINVMAPFETALAPRSILDP